MKLATNIIFQVLALILQSANLITGLVPPKYQPFVMAAITIVQAIVGLKAHFTNTDGTPQQVAFVPQPETK